MAKATTDTTSTIKELRLKLNLNQREFAEKYHIPLKTLQNWEANPAISSHRNCPPYVTYMLTELVNKELQVN